jgi:hypothetical protein
MKKLLISLLVLITVPTIALAQFTVGTNGGDFTTLQQAFDYINGGSVSGDITLQIVDNTTETGTAVLYSSGGEVNYTSVLIFPAFPGLSINGDIDGPLIELNGVDHVTIDGRVDQTGNADLVISNISTGTSASTIRFIESAVTSTIQYCKIEGSETGTSSGVIFFSTTSTGNGNDGITIDNNNLTSSSAGRPINSVYSSGTSGRENSGCTISNNNIYDFLNRGMASSGILISSNTTTWTISGNSFYETTSFIPISNVAYNAIQLNNPSGNGFIITGNYIGGSSALCAGAPWTKTSAFNNTFSAININVGAVASSSIQNNTIKNFNWSNSGNATWTGIQIASGAVNVGTTTGNNIGETNTTGSLIITAGATSGPNAAIFYGINIASGGTVDCQNNNIGSITSANSNPIFASSIYGITKTASAGTTTISNNTIGSASTPASINASSVCSPTNLNTQIVYGILNAGTGTITINGNTIANITNSTNNLNKIISGRVTGILSNAGTNTINNNIIHDLTIANVNSSPTQNASVCGIAGTGNIFLKTISGNSIFNLSNSNTSFIGFLTGIYFTGNTGANIVSGNFIHNFTVSSNDTAKIAGIKMLQGATTYYNNIISLGGNTATTVYGIYETGPAASNNNIYFNTIYISGSPGSGNRNSYCLYSAATTNARDFRNNVFLNARSNSGATGSHYALYIKTGGGTITCDYNDYFASGTGAILGYYGGNKAALPIVTGQDQHSYAVDPVLTVAGSTLATDYTIGVDLIGVNGTGILTDFGSAPRNNPTMGAWERLVNKWKGTTSTAFLLLSNWTASAIPLPNSPIRFDDAAAHDCYLAGDFSVTNVTNGSTRVLATNGHQLTISGNLILTNGAKVDASSTSSTLNYAGILAQTIDANQFVNDKAFNLSIDNTIGVTLNANFTIDNNLTINTGRLLTVSAGRQLTVSGSIINLAGNAGLVFKSDATGDSKLINSTLSVPATVELYLTGGLVSPGVGTFHYFVPPVNSMSIGTTPTIDEVKTALGITNFNGDLLRYNEPQSVSTKEQGWQYFDNYPGDPSGGFTSLVSSRGYNIYLNGSSDILKFKGQLNSANQPFSLSFTTGNAGAGWNLVGNPFPCNYDLNGVAGLGTSVPGISNTVYYNNNGGYTYWNVLLNTGSSGGYSDILPPMTGFFVKVSKAGVPFTMPASSKTGSAADSRAVHKSYSAYEATGSASAINALSLKKVKLVLNSASKTDETIVMLLNDATNSYNEHYDAFKLIDADLTKPSIYSLLNGVNYFMKAVAGPVTTKVIVPLKVVIRQAGTHTISITEFQNLDDLKVVLKHGSVETNLSQNASYTFTASPGTYTDFELVIGDANITTPVEDINSVIFKTWYRNDNLYISCPSDIESGSGSLYVVDIQGKKVYSDSRVYFSPGQTIEIPVNLPRGIYIINFTVSSKSYVSKFGVLQ